jgi:hypothetical protein
MLNDHKPPQLVDIHCHILPGIDDGAFCLLDAIYMAKHAARNGIAPLVATPHHNDGRFTNKAQGVIAGVLQLNNQFRKLNIPVAILPGQEIRVTRHLVSGARRNAANYRTVFDRLFRPKNPKISTKHLKGKKPILLQSRPAGKWLSEPHSYSTKFDIK